MRPGRSADKEARVGRYRALVIVLAVIAVVRRVLDRSRKERRKSELARLLATGFGLGLERGTVRLVEYDPTWPKLFIVVAADLKRALGAVAIGIEHVGSTAVPHLAAKPILDVAVRTDAVEATVRQALCAAGYEFRGYFAGEMLFALEYRPGVRLVNVHVVRDDASWRKYLTFRDWLRSDQVTRHAYERIKRKLAAMHRGDRAAYREAKESMIDKLPAGRRRRRRRWLRNLAAGAVVFVLAAIQVVAIYIVHRD